MAHLIHVMGNYYKSTVSQVPIDILTAKTPNARWNWVIISSDGKTCIANYNNIQIWRSINSGVDWVFSFSSSLYGFGSYMITYSKDVVKLATAIYNEPIRISINSGVTWIVSNSLSLTWTSISSSSDGTNVVACASTNTTAGKIYTSINSGVDWKVSNSPSLKWGYVVLSKSGGKCLAFYTDGYNSSGIYTGVSIGKIYTSINSGVDWNVSNSPTLKWKRIVLSEYGDKCFAVAYDDKIYTSINSGVDWKVSNSPTLRWVNITSSYNGETLVATTYLDKIYTSINYGVDWSVSNTTISNSYFYSMGSSSDGAILIGMDAGNNLWRSRDYGNTWIRVFMNYNWSSVASSPDGVYRVGLVYGGGIYYSNDSGINWTESPNTKDFVSSSYKWKDVSFAGRNVLAVSEGGQLWINKNYGVGGWTNVTLTISNLLWKSIDCAAALYWVAAVKNGKIWRSINMGVAFTETNSPILNWSCVAASYSGQYFVATVDGGKIWTSKNYGVDWNVSNSLILNWTCVASSTLGNKLVAVISGGQIWTSINYGVDWLLSANSSSLIWSGVASSSDGTKLVACVNGGFIWRSTDSGVNWTSRENSLKWSSIASSSDGMKFVASVDGGQIYTIAA
jgi:hypothetical protein